MLKQLTKYRKLSLRERQVLEAENAVNKYRDIMGATNPKDAKEGTIRKEIALNIQENSVHGSDSLENAKIEIDFFFKD